jgi:hypothetical protein
VIWVELATGLGVAGYAVIRTTRARVTRDAIRYTPRHARQ